MLCPSSALTPSHAQEHLSRGQHHPQHPGVLCAKDPSRCWEGSSRAGAAAESLPGTKTRLGWNGRILIFAILACSWLRNLCQGTPKGFARALGQAWDEDKLFLIQEASGQGFSCSLSSRGAKAAPLG